MSEKEYFKQLEEYDKEVNKLFKENKELKSRIDKAIEYINDNGIIDLNGYDLLKILKGE